MRYNKEFFDLVDSGDFTGSNRPCGRVTLEADWMLNLTPTGPNWANSIRGPYRWFQRASNNQIEVELPNVKTISWDRNVSESVASASIEVYNQWHDPIGDGEEGSVVPEDVDVLGRPGFFWPGHGGGDASTVWGQEKALGAVGKDGTVYPSFEWEQALVPYALLRTYEGYGGHDLTIEAAVTAGKIHQTGVWLVTNVSASADGMLSLSCKDIGKLLIDQLVTPPLIPKALYPLEYYPDGKSAFDSYWEPNPKTGVTRASQGAVKLQYWSSSLGQKVSGSPTADPVLLGHRSSEAIDRNDNTYALTYGHSTPDAANEWIQFRRVSSTGKSVNMVEFRPWAGGYTCYLSLSVDGSTWLGGNTIPSKPADYAANINYVSKVTVPLSIPDGREQTVKMSVPDEYKLTQILHIRLTFCNFYYGNFAGQTAPYRAGVREVKAYQLHPTFAPNYGNPTPNDPWTYAIAAHPTRGYWVADWEGNVHGFGDALDYTIPIGDYSVIGMDADPSGDGGLVVTRNGIVYGFGTTHPPISTPQITVPAGTAANTPDGVQAYDIAITHTGLGYFIVYSDGRVRAFGDARDVVPTWTVSGASRYYDLPWSAVDAWMDNVAVTYLVPADNPFGFLKQTEPFVYGYTRRGTSIATHPSKPGCWVTTGSGEVYAFGQAKHHGQLVNREYNKGRSGNFKISPMEYTHAIEPTTTGNGYWIAFGSGRIAAFGDAVGQGPTDIYEKQRHPGLELDIPPEQTNNWSFFKALVWGLVADPDGTGFWVLVADGTVGHFNAEFWGQPGYYGLSGYRWFEGNYRDYTDVIRELLLWSGWLLYDPADSSASHDPPVWGSLESTGIPSDAEFGADIFDKKTIIDSINYIKEVVGYSFWIDWDGSAIFTSPNWWQAGNIDTSSTEFSGGRIYVDDDGNQVSSSHEEAQLFIPQISEELSLLNYQSSLDGESLRSELIIGNNKPDYRDPSTTGFVKYIPDTAVEEIRPGVPALRGIVKPAMLIKEAFENTEEMKLMAELINLQLWFTQRTGSATIVGNPLLGINDQVTVRERNTSDTFLHYIRGISSSLDLDTGIYTMDVTTNWLGSEDNWVITADPSEGSINNVVVSNKVDKWQSQLGLGLSSTGASSNVNVALLGSASFNAATTVYGDPGWDPYSEIWIFQGTLTVPVEIEDFTVTTLQRTANLGPVASFEISEAGGGSVETADLALAGEKISLADLPAGEYEFVVQGTPSALGSGALAIRFDGSTVQSIVMIDSTLIVAVPTAADVFMEEPVLDSSLEITPPTPAISHIVNGVGGLTHTNVIGTESVEEL